MDDYELEDEEVDVENDDHETQEICEGFLPIIIFADSMACEVRKEDDWWEEVDQVWDEAPYYERLPISFVEDFRQADY